MPKDTTPNTISIAPPSWAFAVPILLAALESGTDTGKALARAEITRMGSLLDAAAAQVEEATQAQAEAFDPSPYTSTHDLLAAMNYDTVMGWLAKHKAAYLQAMYDPIEETRMAGWRCRALTERSGGEVIKVQAPPIMRDRHLLIVNAYPVEVIAEWWREND